MINLTTDLRLLKAPGEIYRERAAQPAGAARRDAVSVLLRASLIAAIAGTATAVAATGRVTWRLAVSGAICCSFVALLQVAIALLVISPSAPRPRWLRATDLFFRAHAAWSLWLIGVAAVVAAAAAGTRVMLYTACVPLAWTAVMVYAFFRHVLELPPRRAAMRTAIHQALTLLAIVLYVGWAMQLWPRILSMRTP